MTCLSGHSSSIYNLAITAFFFSQTSEDMEVFMLPIVECAMSDVRQHTIKDHQIVLGVFLE
jgi:hypothetical protein